jgi:hypothetical protein
MQVGQNQAISEPLAGVNPAAPIKAAPEKELHQKTAIIEPDSSHLDSKNGKAQPHVTFVQDPAQTEKAKPAKLTGIEVGGSILNDSNMFVQDEDDLGMTTSYTAYTKLAFSNANGSSTDIFLNHGSALHTQFLSKADQVTQQSTLTTQDFEVGVRNNAWLLSNPHFSTGAKLQFKGIDTNPASGWANVQADLHHFAGLRQYQNQANPYVSDAAYLTPMATLDFEQETIKAKIYLKTEAHTALGAMIPMQQNSDFYTPIRADASGSVKFGYAYQDKPLIYLKMDGGISNDPLPYNRDQGTLGAVGLALGNEFTLSKRKNRDINLLLETKVIQPFGNLPGNPLPDQPGKHELIHEMFNLKLQFKLK